MKLDDLLDATRDVADAPDTIRNRARAQTLSATQASVDRITYLSKARIRRRRLVRVVAVGAAAAAIAVVAVRLNTSPVTPPRAAPPIEAVEFTTASQVLTAASEATAEAGVDASTAKYWRVESEYQQGDDPVSMRIFWQGHTSPGYLYDEAFGDTRLTKMPKASFSYGAKSLTWDELTRLTTSPEELVALLRTATGGFTEERGPDYYAFKQVGELLGESPAPPALRKALWKAVAMLEGISNDGPTTDAVGRTGYAISRWGLTYVVAPDTGELLEYRIVPVAPATSTYRLTYISRGPADSARWPE